ncbi:hypothetical protein POTOM_007452 [Populus tomentosa]|uniref:Ammonium transporter AmtB-like domain-containing protein n=1 Tax=Populus tomentosa TaxID=118781 RepID=A0A8X8AF87_POPTO|nr:hypothetical protein POTOM_007452 [Populus tomentosa]
MAELPINLLPNEASPAWMNKGDNAWQLTAATLVGLQSVPGLVILYGNGWLAKRGIIDYSGGYVFHLSSAVAGFTAAYWVGPRTNKDRERFPPNNIILMLAGAGLLWTGWSGFNGGDPYTVSTDASLAVLNTHVWTATPVC